MKKNFMNNNFYMLREIWKVSKGYFLYTIILIFMKVINNVLFMLIGKLVIDVLTVNGDYTKIIHYGIMLAISSLTQQFYSSWYYMKKTKIVTLKVQKRFQSTIFEKAKNIDLSCYETPMFYDQYVKAISEVDARAMEVFNTFANFINNILNICSVMAILVTLDIWMIVFSIINLVLSFMLSNLKNKLIYEYNYKQQEIERQRSYVKRIFYLPEYAKEVKLFPIAQKLVGKFLYETQKIENLIKTKYTKIFLTDASAGSVNSFISVSMIMYLSFRVFTGGITVGDFLALEKATSNLTINVRNFLNSISEFKNHSLYIDNYLNFINYEAKIKINDTGISLDNTSNISYFLENVSFKYPNSDKSVLKNINFEIKNGEKIAIVGYNGSGKTTLMKILLRLYDASEGMVNINGNCIKDYNVKSIWSNTGVIFQDAKLYAISVKDNITTEFHKHGNKDIITALKKVNLFNKIYASKFGIETYISKELSEDGIVLSGGESQALCLSRIFLNNYQSIILDEPTSSLDPISEDKILTKIFEESDGKTIIISTHRLSCVKFVDRIIFMKDGEVKEMGTHDELIESDGEYAKMYKAQAKYYFNNI